MHRKKGFTLIELVVVIGLIALLATIVLSNLNGSRMKSRDVQRVSDINQIQKALQLYVTNQGKFPAELDLTTNPTFMALYPGTLKDPLGVAYKYVPLGGSGACTGYHLGAVLEEPGTKFLSGDVDAAASSNTCAGTDFNGASTDCASGVGADLCYDVKQ